MNSTSLHSCEQHSSTLRNNAVQTSHRPAQWYIYASIRNVVAIADYFVRSPEPLEKVVKNAHRMLEILAKVKCVTDVVWIGFASTLKSAADLFESIRVISVAKLLLTPQRNNQYFLFDPTVSAQKKADRLFLLAHTSCKTVRGLNKWKLIDLGNFGKMKIGTQLPVFHLLTDGLMLASGTFGLWDIWPKLQKIAKEKASNFRKMHKWENRPLSLGRVLSGDKEEIGKFQVRCETKIAQIGGEIEAKRQELNVRQALLAKSVTQVGNQDEQTASKEAEIIQQKIASLEKKLSKNENRLQKLQSHAYVDFARELSDKDILGKIEKLKAKKDTLQNRYFTNMVRIASTVSKIFVITLALLFTAANLFSTLPTIALLACGFIADSLGLIKLFDEKGPTLISIS